MCKTRIKVLCYPFFEKTVVIESAVNDFIKDPKNKVAKVNSISSVSSGCDEDGDAGLLITINYELGD